MFTQSGGCLHDGIQKARATMRVVIQKVTEASVSVEEKIIGEIGTGFMLLVGIGKEDTEEDVDYMVRKVSNLRVFEDEEGKMNLSLKDVSGAILSISQFTLDRKSVV